MTLQERYRGALLGLAAGDAVGTTAEFAPRGSFAPLTDMAGGGPFGLEPGQWTDDTSMALCLAASLVERGGFDARDQMDRYCRWRDTGYMSSTGRCFDIGNATSSALSRYRRTREPFSGSEDPRSAGNGSIMRLAPAPMFFYPDIEAAETHAALSSRTTHAAAECVDACRLMARILCRALAGAPKTELAFGDRGRFAGSSSIVAIADGAYSTKSEAEIRGTGCVVASLEAAMWCFMATDNFESAILRAANLGDDADTTAAVCGQIAGAHYGVHGIPEHWRAKLAMHDTIVALADALCARPGRGEAQEDTA